MRSRDRRKVLLAAAGLTRDQSQNPDLSQIPQTQFRSLGVVSGPFPFSYQSYHSPKIFVSSSVVYPFKKYNLRSSCWRLQCYDDDLSHLPKVCLSSTSQSLVRVRVSRVAGCG